jgi:hypothetical protein
LPFIREDRRERADNLTGKTIPNAPVPDYYATAQTLLILESLKQLTSVSLTVVEKIVASLAPKE